MEVGTKKYTIPFKLYVGKNDLCDGGVKRSPKKKLTKTFFSFEEKITKMLGKKFATADFYFKNCCRRCMTYVYCLRNTDFIVNDWIWYKIRFITQGEDEFSTLQVHRVKPRTPSLSTNVP